MDAQARPDNVIEIWTKDVNKKNYPILGFRTVVELTCCQIPLQDLTNVLCTVYCTKKVSKLQFKCLVGRSTVSTCV